jgi:poly-gamma-glutamate synthesis protein (capsule biosynthesis protein)
MGRYRGIRCAIAGLLLLALFTVQLQEGITEYETVSGDALTIINADLPELQDDFSSILSCGTKEFFQGYPVDESFLLWIAANYGESVIERLAANVQSEQQDVSAWYELTGSTIHVLWLLYCRDLNYSSYLLKNVTWADCADETDITMDFIGDINFSEDWYTTTALDERGGELENCISPEILEELKSADITVANNEFSFSTRGTALAGKAYRFRANPERVSYYGNMGVDIVTMANNHTWDYGEEAFLDTIDTLNNAGISYVGAGENLEEAKTIRYFVANGRKIAIVSATQIEKFHAYTQEAGENSPGVLKTLDPEIFLEVIREAEENSDYVIACVHWGTEGNLYPDDDERILSEQYVAAGADIVIGGHAHRLQGISYIDDTPVIYSMGNFWFSTGDLYTTILQVTINRFGELNVTFLPCEQKDLTVSLLAGEGAEGFYEYLADLSSGIGIDENGTVWQYEDTLKVQWRYLSGMNYGTHSGGADLAGNGIDIVGNLK